MDGIDNINCVNDLSEPNAVVKPNIEGRPSISPPEALANDFLNNTVPNAKDKIIEIFVTQKDIVIKEHEISVKLAKKQFFINVIELTVSLASFVVSVGMSICSGGAATPVAIITGVNLMLSLSNLACAYHNWNCASKNKEGLTMGSDAIQQAAFMLAKSCGVSSDNCKKIARYTSFFIRVGIVASLAGIGLLTHPVVTNSLCLLAKNYNPIVASITSIITAGALGVWISNDHDQKKEIEGILRSNELEANEILITTHAEGAAYRKIGIIKDNVQTNFA
ncbi:hypothetical protein V1951_04700 [Yersinia sp. 2544 StPb PI]|uniref:hypothetical protein n=1 Tax=unclassified Yersinia (in: enterobacteria) TaxID=2653513 RepID=UPI0009F3BD9A|nr:hypothetical protein A6J66_014995 [Yersinia enterocolitica]